MEQEEIRIKQIDALGALEAEDLATLSVDELENRAERLRAEITRSDVAATAKRAGKDAADAAFK